MFLSQNSGISIWIPSTHRKIPHFSTDFGLFFPKSPVETNLQTLAMPCALRRAMCGCRGTRSSTLRSAARKTSRQPGAPEGPPQAIRPCSSALDINCCRFLGRKTGGIFYSNKKGIGSWKNGDHLRYLDISGITIYSICKYLYIMVDWWDCN